MSRARIGLADPRQTLEDYRVLGLEAGAPIREVRSAFRRLVKRWHPDVCDQPAEVAARETQRLYQAFGRLRSLSPRELDGARRRHVPVPAARGGRPGRDVVSDLVLTPLQARVGSRWLLRIATCRRCGGWGDAPGRDLRVCPACDGLGRHRRLDGVWDLDVRCPRCQGHGCLLAEPCPACDAWGASGFYTVRCLVPGFGPADGIYRRVAGQGHPGVGRAPAGDLFLRIEVRGAPADRGAEEGAA